MSDIDALFEAAAGELGKSPIFARALADRLSSDNDLMLKLVERIDPEILSKAIANNIVHASITNRRYDIAVWEQYRSIVRMAQDKAAGILAKEIIHNKLTPANDKYQSMRNDVSNA